MTYWFKRFVKDCKKTSPHVRIKKLGYGFWRLYWTGGCEPAYIGEFYEEMPYKGYDKTDLDPRLESQKYYEEYEDHVKLVRTIKNFVEGYWDSLETFKKRIYLLRNNKEYYETATKAYRQVKIR